MKDEDFVLHMNVVEYAAWCYYISVVKEFLGKNKADNYQELVEMMLTNFQALKARMSINVHYLFSHKVRNRVNGSIRTSNQWKRGTKVDVTLT